VFTLVNFNKTTQHNNSEDGRIHIRQQPWKPEISQIIIGIEKSGPTTPVLLKNYLPMLQKFEEHRLNFCNRNIKQRRICSQSESSLIWQDKERLKINRWIQAINYFKYTFLEGSWAIFY
jgi:hypothetical protein